MPTKDYGKFYTGDSYIIINVSQNKLFYQKRSNLYELTALQIKSMRFFLSVSHANRYISIYFPNPFRLHLSDDFQPIFLSVFSVLIFSRPLRFFLNSKRCISGLSKPTFSFDKNPLSTTLLTLYTASLLIVFLNLYSDFYLKNLCLRTHFSRKADFLPP